MSTCSQFAKEYTNLTKIPLDAHLDVIAQFICRETPMTHLLWVGQTISWMDGDKLTRAHICKIQVFAQKKKRKFARKICKNSEHQFCKISETQICRFFRFWQNFMVGEKFEPQVGGG